MTSGVYKRTLKPIVCGTSGSYQAHRKRGENCEFCKTVHAEKKRRQYISVARNAPSRSDKRQFIINRKFEAGQCAHCLLQVTQDNWIIFDWDHLDPLKKSFQLSEAKKHTIEQIADEIMKCQLLCSNCHRLHTYNEKHYLKGRERKHSTALPMLFQWQETSLL